MTLNTTSADCLRLLKDGVDVWNQWRSHHPDAVCNLAYRELSEEYFFEANFNVSSTE